MLSWELSIPAKRRTDRLRGGRLSREELEILRARLARIKNFQNNILFYS